MIKKMFIVMLGWALIVAPTVGAQEVAPTPNEPSAASATSSPSAPPARAPKNQIDITGDTVVSSESAITVVPSVIDEELHNRAMLLRAIGTPLYDAGEVLLSISVATWVAWTLAYLPVAVVGQSSFEVSGFDLNIGGATDGLLTTSIALSATGLALLIGGGITRSVGDDLRDRSFAELQ